ncbi:MAG: DUF1289 domain-containing protein [Pseudomonas sp.]|jgi:predicted Fe-S protein YdhL (DUF1289 family)|uniref:DUF1289 domain-containing protein n=1 Tax=Pseudomonas sp. TaxID=306 RepID=UPI0012008023|nr:DUF1289 domain-containing protein [Pseudomonas sp.]RZI76199.1 MAG: DUF1289 domain-containing protein [Pseudomonas sp.]
MSSAIPPIHEATVHDKPIHEKPVRSPCVSICALDDADICTGCQRTVAEITSWSRMDNQARRAVLIACEERARASGMMFLLGGNNPQG